MYRYLTQLIVKYICIITHVYPNAANSLILVVSKCRGFSTGRVEYDNCFVGFETPYSSCAAYRPDVNYFRAANTKFGEPAFPVNGCTAAAGHRSPEVSVRHPPDGRHRIRFL